MSNASRDDQQRVRVAPIRGGQGVFACEPLDTGARIFVLAGIVVHAPTRRTLQLTTHTHLDIPPGSSDAEARTSFPWCFLNHGCDPNSRMEERTLIALRPIAVGEEIQFDYNTTEWDMTDAFACGCAATDCSGAPVRGFRYLTRSGQERRRALLAPHLRDRMAPDVGDS